MTDTTPTLRERPVRRPPVQVQLDRAPAEDILRYLREAQAAMPGRAHLFEAAADYVEGQLLAAWHEDRRL